MTGSQPDRIIRQLNRQEREQNLSFSMTLRLRNRALLEQRIAAGEALTLAQLQQDHLPTPTDWAAVSRWARNEGFAVSAEDNNHLTVFLAGSVANIERALQVRFGRVLGSDGGEYSSAVSTLSLPTAIAEHVAGFLHLRPHLRPAPRRTAAELAQAGVILPQDVARLYNAVGLGLTGRGQVIVVRGDAAIDRDDLVAFWTNTGLPVTLAQYHEVIPSANTSLASTEFTMDIEWASAMAPGAQIVYFGSLGLDQLFSWITSRPADAPAIWQTTLSMGLPESCYRANGYPPVETEYYAAMAALGINNFVSSGNHGSHAATERNIWPGEAVFVHGTTLTVDYPASDPYVVAVGGTTIQAGASGTSGALQEGAWSLPANLRPEQSSGYNASTGGMSMFFTRPIWQTGGGLPLGDRRAVPDVAAVAMSDRALYTVLGGIEVGAGGTSLSAPVWAGLSALIQEGLQTGGGRPGFLPPRLYAQLGTEAFHQITVGANRSEPMSSTASNGAYRVGRDYNLITGLGSPDIGKLVKALGGAIPAAPVITQQPTTTTVASGQTARFSVSATGAGPLAYQWMIDGVIVYDGLQANTSVITGAHTANLSIENVQVTQDSNSVFRSGSGRQGISVIVSNRVGIAVGEGAKLFVLPPPGAPQYFDPPTSKWGSEAVIGDDLELAAPDRISGTDLRYQWYHNGHPIPGATTRKWVIPNATESEAGVYLVTIANAAGVISSPLLHVTMTEPRFIAPKVTTPLRSTTIYPDQPVRLSVGAEAPGPIRYSWSHNGVKIPGASSRSLFIRSARASDAGSYVVLLLNEMLSGNASEANLTFDSSMTWPAVVATADGTSQPGSRVSLTAVATGSPAPALQWQRNGHDVADARRSELVLPALQPQHSGVYTATATNAAGSRRSDAAIVGVSTTEKVIGSGKALEADVRHPNGNVFDQVLATGAAEAITADGGQITRTSYIDLDNDIVQVEFSGAGTLTLVLDEASASARPINYDQDIAYVKGHAGIVIVGADETTNLSVFTVGRVTAYDPTGQYILTEGISENNDPARNGNPIFDGHPVSDYDGIADLAFVAISSKNGRFGGIRASNAHFFASRGFAGIYAPGVEFEGKLFIGDVTAFDTAMAVIVVGAVGDARITGGDLLQENGTPVSIGGISKLAFTPGMDSHGRALPQKPNRGMLERDGVDVTADLVGP